MADLKSAACNGRAGSSPAPRTKTLEFVMCKKLCPTCLCVNKIPAAVNPSFPEYFLYIFCKMADGSVYRVYGPHVYREVQLDFGLGKYTQWHATDLPSKLVLDNAIEVFHVE